MRLPVRSGWRRSENLLEKITINRLIVIFECAVLELPVYGENQSEETEGAGAHTHEKRSPRRAAVY